MAMLSGSKQAAGALYATDYENEAESGQALSEEKKENALLNRLSRIGKRNWIIVGAVALIGVAVALNWHFLTADTGKDSYASYDQAAGMVGQSETETGAQSQVSEDYFATAELNRRQARDASLEVLQNVLDSELADGDVKAQAMEEMRAIADEIDTEANIESLLISKGFSDCIAILNGSSVNVIVKSEGELQPAQIAQINAVVFEQTGIEPAGIVINHHP